MLRENPYFDIWRDCTPEDIINHILYQRLHGPGLASYGIPRFDLDFARYRKDLGQEVDMTSVLEAAYGKLEKSDQELQAEIDKCAIYLEIKGKTFTVQDYRNMVVRTLKYIEQLELAAVDWNRVQEYVPGAPEIDFDANRHSDDVGIKLYQMAEGLRPGQFRYLMRVEGLKSMLRSNRFLLEDLDSPSV